MDGKTTVRGVLEVVGRFSTERFAPWSPRGLLEHPTEDSLGDRPWTLDFRGLTGSREEPSVLAFSYSAEKTFSRSAV